jgi:hypothetical protein
VSEVSIPEEAIEAANAQYVGNEAGVERAVRAAAPLIVAANAITEIPDDVAFRAWEELVYPLTAVDRPMTPGFKRAMTVINQWLTDRAV